MNGMEETIADSQVLCNLFQNLLFNLNLLVLLEKTVPVVAWSLEQTRYAFFVLCARL